MKSVIVSVIAALGLSITAAMAAEVQSNTPGASSGLPGTPTPTPYPQVTTSTVPTAGGIDNNSPLLPPIKVPAPPRDDDLPGLQKDAQKVKPPGG
ncbi:MAG: hypothetical protein PW845_26750 [Pseudomonas sp.]|uniref:hypothetical protein n=1 Tax=Pseudomonas abieticivorans TaxID=2931382 RepID=UPI0020BF06C4|nr:hypothetical protein [Pseudomonas sp. PIA16]MDE1168882.1 hypothetical protein [Pseudomonas sp.]